MLACRLHPAEFWAVSRQPCYGRVAHSPLEYVYGFVVVCVAGVAAFWAFEEASGSKPYMPASMARFRSVFLAYLNDFYSKPFCLIFYEMA